MLSRFPDQDLVVHVVWMPVMVDDKIDAVAAATQTIPDSRARHYWDGDLSLGFAYGALVTLPNGEDLAWDTYFAFERDALWSDQPPVPNKWWHELRNDNHKTMSTQHLREYLVSQNK